MMAHWLVHYANAGVRLATHAHVTIHEDFSSSSVIHAARRVLEMHDVRDMQLLSSMNANKLEGIKLERLNAFIRGLPTDAWLIFADIDEFFSYPCDILARLHRTYDRFGRRRRAVCTLMQDRLAIDGSLPRVKPQPSIFEQYSMCAKMRGLGAGLIAANTLKISLLGARIFGGVPAYQSAHRVKILFADENGAHSPNNTVHNNTMQIGGTPQGQNGCLYTGRYAHFSMTYEAFQLAWRKMSDKFDPNVYASTVGLSESCNASYKLPSSKWTTGSLDRSTTPSTVSSDETDDQDGESKPCLRLHEEARRHANTTRMPCQETCTDGQRCFI